MHDPLFFHNIETNLILYVYPIKAYKIHRNGGTLNLEKPVFDFYLLYPRKNSLKENQKCVHWILRLSNRD